MSEAQVLRSGQESVQEFAWGRLIWYAAGALGNAQETTLGRCVIRPGQENPLHRHPNCEEALHLVAGTVEHVAGEAKWLLEPGDTITIPRGLWHQARNVGTGEAVMFIAYSSPAREMEAR